MRALWTKLVAQVSDAGAFIEEVSRNGLHFLRSSIGALPLFTSTSVDLDETLEVDESHYFLVPYRMCPCGYALYTVRALPPGVGPSNPLPKARIFHLHHLTAVRVLEDLLAAERHGRLLAGRCRPKSLGLHRADLRWLAHLRDVSTTIG